MQNNPTAIFRRFIFDRRVDLRPRQCEKATRLSATYTRVVCSAEHTHIGRDWKDCQQAHAESDAARERVSAGLPTCCCVLEFSDGFYPATGLFSPVYESCCCCCCSGIDIHIERARNRPSDAALPAPVRCIRVVFAWSCVNERERERGRVRDEIVGREWERGNLGGRGRLEEIYSWFFGWLIRRSACPGVNWM